MDINQIARDENLSINQFHYLGTVNFKNKYI